MKLTPTQTVACLATATALAGAGWIVQRSYQDGGPGVLLASRGGGWSLLGAGKNATPAAPVPTPSTKDLQMLRSTVFGEGGVVALIRPPGDWPVDARGQLMPSVVLRQRFDYYLSGLGQASVADVRTLLAGDAQAAVGPQAAAAIVDLFDRYWLLRSSSPRVRLDPAAPNSWAPALAEQQARRRQLLGTVWADAFFQAEETFFERLAASAETEGRDAAQEAANMPPGYPGSPLMQMARMAAGPDPSMLHADRVARHGEADARRLDEADAAWQTRLGQAGLVAR